MLDKRFSHSVWWSCSGGMHIWRPYIIRFVIDSQRKWIVIYTREILFTRSGVEEINQFLLINNVKWEKRYFWLFLEKNHPFSVNSCWPCGGSHHESLINKYICLSVELRWCDWTTYEYPQLCMIFFLPWFWRIQK